MTRLVGTEPVRIVEWNYKKPYKCVYLWCDSSTYTIYIGFDEIQLRMNPTSGYKLSSSLHKIEYQGDIYAVGAAADQEIEVLVIPQQGDVSKIL